MADHILASLKGKLAGLVGVTAGAREAIAGRQLGPQAVTEAAAEAAAKGFDELVIEPEGGVDLRHTKCAQNLLALLSAAGFEARWAPRQPRADRSPVYDLVVSWRPKG